jgi:hypothetical protein
MIECEEFVVFLTQVVHTKMHRSAVGSCGEHHVEHDLRDPYLFLLRELLFLRWLVVTAPLSSLGVFSLFLFEEGCNSVLSPELLPGFL